MQIQLLITLSCCVVFGVHGWPWLHRPGTSRQYQFNDDENSWMYARERCKAGGGDLASINDDAELVRCSPTARHGIQEWLRSHYPVAGLNERAALVGLHMSTDDGGGWKWLDGTVFANNQTLYAH
jgi:hypothetical protein